MHGTGDGPQVYTPARKAGVGWEEVHMESLSGDFPKSPLILLPPLSWELVYITTHHAKETGSCSHLLLLLMYLDKKLESCYRGR